MKTELDRQPSPIRTALLRAHAIAVEFGMDFPRFIRALCRTPRYVRHLARFRKSHPGVLGIAPCLSDWDEEAGSSDNEYFWQDLLVAQMIFQANPRRHIDAGSRLDGFIAHVASFRQIEILDVRPMSREIPNVRFRRHDFSKPVPGLSGCSDSVSCLHALEHFGLGRYGDDLDPSGFERGFSSLADLLAAGGRLYLSVPVGRSAVAFNSHRVVDPEAVLALAAGHGLRPQSFTSIGPLGSIETLAVSDPRFAALGQLRYTLGVFVFQKQ